MCPKPVAGRQSPMSEIGRGELVSSILSSKVSDPLLKGEVPMTVSAPIRHSQVCPTWQSIAGEAQGPAASDPEPTP